MKKTHIGDISLILLGRSVRSGIPKSKKILSVNTNSRRVLVFQWLRICLLEYWMLRAGALGQPRGMEWGGRREEGSGWGTHVYLWWIHFDIWQN